MEKGLSSDIVVVVVEDMLVKSLKTVPHSNDDLPPLPHYIFLIVTLNNIAEVLQSVEKI